MASEEKDVRYWAAIAGIAGTIIAAIALVVGLASHSGSANANGTGQSPQTAMTSTTLATSAPGKTTVTATTNSVPPTTATTAPRPPQPIPLISDSGTGGYVTEENMFGIGVTGGATDGGPLKINGQYFDTGDGGCAAPNCGGPGDGQSYVGFDLSRDFATFSAVIGVTDQSDPSCQAEIQIVEDGSTVLDQTFAYGQSKPLSLDVSGVLNLKFVVAQTTETANAPSECVGAIGDPTATP
jgi:hypothetical protein